MVLHTNVRNYDLYHMWNDLGEVMKKYLIILLFCCSFNSFSAGSPAAVAIMTASAAANSAAVASYQTSNAQNAEKVSGKYDYIVVCRANYHEEDGTYKYMCLHPPHEDGMTSIAFMGTTFYDGVWPANIIYYMRIK